MKILRVLRRRKIKLSFIFLLLLVFIVNTYAWMRTDKNADAGNLLLDVDDWSVAFIVDDEEIQTEQYTFEIPEFHPGIAPIEKQIDVYNIGEANSFIKYEITEIYLYGEQIYKIEQGEGENAKLIPETIATETVDANGRKTANLFGNNTATIFDDENTKYSFSLRYPTPFTISYTYDKTYVKSRDDLEATKS